MDHRSPATRNARSSLGWRAAMAATTCAAGILAFAGPGGPSPAGAATHDVPLVVYSAQGYDVAETKAFQKATGIKVELDTNSTGPLLTQIEASKNNPKWGLLWVDGSTAFAGLDQQHLLVRGFEPHVHWNSLGSQAVPKDKSYVPTGITLTDALIYTSKVVTDPPTTWSQLLSPKWKGAVGMDNPAQSGPTYPFIAGMMQHLGGDNGVAAGEHYFTQLHDNGLVVHTTNGTTLQALASGQIKVALVQSSAAVGAKSTDPNFVVKYLPPITVLPSAIGIDKKAPKAEQAEAKRFAEFVLSKHGQKVMQSGDPTGDSLYYPVVDGGQPLSALPALTSVKTQNITPYMWGKREQTINTWFVTNVVQ